MIARFAFACEMAWMAFVEAWVQWRVDMVLARRGIQKTVRGELQERRLRVIEGGRGLPGKGVA